MTTQGQRNRNKGAKTCLNKDHDHILSIHALIQEKIKVPSHQCHCVGIKKGNIIKLNKAC